MEIFPSIFLGDRSTSQDPLFMVNNKITYVLNCSGGDNFFENVKNPVYYREVECPNSLNSERETFQVCYRKGKNPQSNNKNGENVSQRKSTVRVIHQVTMPYKINYFKIAIDDSVSADFEPHFKPCMGFCEIARKNEENVLIHCHRGQSRSVTAIVAYGMKFEKKMLYTSYKYVAEKCSSIGHQINVNNGFKKALMTYEAKLFDGFHSIDFFRKRDRPERGSFKNLSQKALSKAKEDALEIAVENKRKKRKLNMEKRKVKMEMKKQREKEDRELEEKRLREKVKRKKKKKKKKKRKKRKEEEVQRSSHKKKKKKKKKKRKKEKGEKKDLEKKESKKEKEKIEIKKVKSPKRNIVENVITSLSNDLDGGYWSISNSRKSGRRNRARISYNFDDFEDEITRIDNVKDDHIIAPLKMPEEHVKMVEKKKKTELSKKPSEEITDTKPLGNISSISQPSSTHIPNEVPNAIFKKSLSPQMSPQKKKIPNNDEKVNGLDGGYWNISLKEKRNRPLKKSFLEIFQDDSNSLLSLDQSNGVSNFSLCDEENSNGRLSSMAESENENESEAVIQGNKNNSNTKGRKSKGLKELLRLDKIPELKYHPDLLRENISQTNESSHVQIKENVTPNSPPSIFNNEEIFENVFGLEYKKMMEMDSQIESLLSQHRENSRPFLSSSDIINVNYDVVKKPLEEVVEDEIQERIRLKKLNERIVCDVDLINRDNNVNEHVNKNIVEDFYYTFNSPEREEEEEEEDRIEKVIVGVLNEENSKNIKRSALKEINGNVRRQKKMLSTKLDGNFWKIKDHVEKKNDKGKRSIRKTRRSEFSRL